MTPSDYAKRAMEARERQIRGNKPREEEEEEDPAPVKLKFGSEKQRAPAFQKKPGAKIKQRASKKGNAPHRVILGKGTVPKPGRKLFAYSWEAIGDLLGVSAKDAQILARPLYKYTYKNEDVGKHGKRKQESQKLLRNALFDPKDLASLVDYVERERDRKRWANAQRERTGSGFDLDLDFETIEAYLDSYPGSTGAVRSLRSSILDGVRDRLREADDVHPRILFPDLRERVLKERKERIQVLEQELVTRDARISDLEKRAAPIAARVEELQDIVGANKTSFVRLEQEIDEWRKRLHRSHRENVEIRAKLKALVASFLPSKDLLDQWVAQHEGEWRAKSGALEKGAAPIPRTPPALRERLVALAPSDRTASAMPLVSTGAARVAPSSFEWSPSSFAAQVGAALHNANSLTPELGEPVCGMPRVGVALDDANFLPRTERFDLTNHFPCKRCGKALDVSALLYEEHRFCKQCSSLEPSKRSMICDQVGPRILQMLTIDTAVSAETIREMYVKTYQPGAWRFQPGETAYPGIQLAVVQDLVQELVVRGQLKTVPTPEGESQLYALSFSPQPAA